jgi:hypothetical protein
VGSDALTVNDDKTWPPSPIALVLVEQCRHFANDIERGKPVSQKVAVL